MNPAKMSWLPSLSLCACLFLALDVAPGGCSRSGGGARPTPPPVVQPIPDSDSDAVDAEPVETTSPEESHP
ncbi:hypothetical protein [Lignipirellula cremea]|uniref:Secreted protein n=1 Tax=Lignipirellula cremea TaxID=2528010 RepID=A0A518DZN8_9BACT|nr:hypothetical protein [Lignipirellula cremea]QDU97307.1 hypothetical protein Pla8534_51530 [Lignipirellula cremea]